MTKFRKADDNEGLIFRKTRKVAHLPEIEIGVFPVMFGYRVRVGMVGSWTMELDYCAGPKQEDVEQVYSLTIAILNKNMDKIKEGDFMPAITKGFPKQDVKPMFNDPDCFIALAKEAGDRVEKVSLEGLEERRNLYFKRYV